MSKFIKSVIISALFVLLGLNLYSHNDILSKTIGLVTTLFFGSLIIIVLYSTVKKITVKK